MRIYIRISIYVNEYTIVCALTTAPSLLRIGILDIFIPTSFVCSVVWWFVCCACDLCFVENIYLSVYSSATTGWDRPRWRMRLIAGGGPRVTQPGLNPTLSDQIPLHVCLRALCMLTFDEHTFVCALTTAPRAIRISVESRNTHGYISSFLYKG